jgi:hypothetical protein
MRIINNLLVLFSLILTIGVSSAFAQPAIGSIVQDQLNIQTTKDGLKIIPLPPGKWYVIFSQKERSGGDEKGNQNRYINIELAETSDNLLKKFLSIRLNDDAEGHKRYTNEPCKVTNIHHKNDYGSRLWDQKCLVVSHVAGWLQTGNNDSFSAIRAYFLTNNILIPSTTFGMNYTQFDSYGGFLRVILRFNPIAYGFADSSASYEMSPWQKDLIRSDSAKSQFAAKVVAYSEAYANALQGAFNKRPLPFTIQFDETSQSGNSLSVDDLRKKCMEIGFKKGTAALDGCIKELQGRGQR